MSDGGYFTTSLEPHTNTDLAEFSQSVERAAWPIQPTDV